MVLGVVSVTIVVFFCPLISIPYLLAVILILPVNSVKPFMNLKLC